MCDCINTINAMLSPEHTLHTTMGFHGGISLPIIPLIRRDNWKVETRRDKPRSIFASFCPWCGAKYEEYKKTEAE